MSTNGHTIDGLGAPTPDQAAAMQTAINGLSPPLKAVAMTVITGAIGSAGPIPPQIVMNVFAFQLGHHFAQAFGAPDIASINAVREGFRKAFTDGMKSVPVMSRLTPVGAGMMPPPDVLQRS